MFYLNFEILLNEVKSINNINILLKKRTLKNPRIWKHIVSISWLLHKEIDLNKYINDHS